jgi:hypothetical protein
MTRATNRLMNDALEPEIQTCLRLPRSLKRRIAKHRQRMCAAMPGIKFSLNAATVNLLLQALDRIEKTTPTKRHRAA